MIYGKCIFWWESDTNRIMRYTRLLFWNITWAKDYVSLSHTLSAKLKSINTWWCVSDRRIQRSWIFTCRFVDNPNHRYVMKKVVFDIVSSVYKQKSREQQGTHQISNFSGLLKRMCAWNVGADPAGCFQSTTHFWLSRNYIATVMDVCIAKMSLGGTAWGNLALPAARLTGCRMLLDNPGFDCTPVHFKQFSSNLDRVSATVCWCWFDIVWQLWKHWSTKTLKNSSCGL